MLLWQLNLLQKFWQRMHAQQFWLILCRTISTGFGIASFTRRESANLQEMCHLV